MSDDQYRLGCDIGGTFTDFVLVNERTQEVVLEKCLTTPDDPSDGILEGLRLLNDRVPGVTEKIHTIVHGTTLVINTLLQARGARTGLLTTEGFRDVIEMRREQRFDKFDLFQTFPPALVPRHRRLGVKERLHASGRVIEKLCEESALTAIRTLEEFEVEAVAICLLHSYANPVHEERLAEVVERHLPGVPVSLSSQVLPRQKEYERFSTTVVNAYVQPTVDAYLAKLEGRLAESGFRGRLYLMNSEGGLITAETARTLPVRIVESGPAGGVIATQRIGEASGLGKLLSFDMGGTTAKVSAVRDGKPVITSDYEVARSVRHKRGSGYHIEAPTVDLLEVGSGGGSLALVNEFGLLQVGPISASSKPGPAAYGLGGQRPAVTDANLVLGYLNPAYFLGGRLRLDVDAARKALKEHVADPMNLSVEEAAWGVYEIVCENMASAARAYLLERGDSPRDFSVVAYGGAGPVHGLRVAQKLDAPSVIVPPATGTLSALGFLAAEPAIRVSRTFHQALNKLDRDAVKDAYDSLQRDAQALLPATDEDGERSLSLQAEMRYRGQGYTVLVDLTDTPPWEAETVVLREAFEEAYQSLYGRTLPSVQVEMLTLWVRASYPPPELIYRARTPDGADQGQEERMAYFPEADGFVSCPVVRRSELVANQRHMGPLIVEEVESTTVVPPNASVFIHPTGAMQIDLRKDSE